MWLVFDAEGTGLRGDCERIWCIVTKGINTKEVRRFGPNEVESGLAHLHEAKALIGHNILGYDFPVFKSLYGWTPREGQRVIDTYILSRLLNTERKAHSVEYYGELFGRRKPAHNDWSKFTPEMLVRCEEDVEITFMIYQTLLREMKYG